MKCDKETSICFPGDWHQHNFTRSCSKGEKKGLTYFYSKYITTFFLTGFRNITLGSETIIPK